MKLYAVNGNSQKLDGGAMFGNAPKGMWEKWITPDELNRIPLACRALLVETEDKKRILFETGIGAFFEPKLQERYGIVEHEHILLKNLKQIGLTDSDIDYVVLSHLHFDHAGGMLSEYSPQIEPQLLFPRAKIFVGKNHWLRACTPHSRDKASFIPLLNEKLQQSGRLVLVDEKTPTELSPLVTFRFSEGHTVGLMISVIHLNNGPLVFASDLIPGAAWVHLPITMGYDRFPETLIDEKRSLLEELVKTNGKLFFTHDSRIAAGVIKKDEKGKFTADAIDLQTLH